MTMKRRIVAVIVASILVAGMGFALDSGSGSAHAAHREINEWPWQVGP